MDRQQFTIWSLQKEIVEQCWAYVLALNAGRTKGLALRAREQDLLLRFSVLDGDRCISTRCGLIMDAVGDSGLQRKTLYFIEFEPEDDDNLDMIGERRMLLRSARRWCFKRPG